MMTMLMMVVVVCYVNDVADDDNILLSFVLLYIVSLVMRVFYIDR